MSNDPNIWQTRPMSPTMLQYAAEDVSQLLLLIDKLLDDLGEAGMRVLPALSKAYAQWYWHAADRDGAQPDSYRYATMYSRSQLVVNISVSTLNMVDLLWDVPSGQSYLRLCKTS